MLAAPTVDHAVRLWSTSTGEARVLRGHKSWVVEVAISPDGRTLASASADRTVRLWDFATGQGRVLEGHAAAVRYVEFAGADHVVSADVAGAVREWSVAGGAGRELSPGSGGISALAASPSGDLVAWADGQGDAHLWSRRAGAARRLPRRDKSIDQLAFAPDGRTLLGRDVDSRVLLWDTASEAVLVLPSYGRTVNDIAVSPDGLMVATAESDRTVRLWPYDLPTTPPPSAAGSPPRPARAAGSFSARCVVVGEVLLDAAHRIAVGVEGAGEARAARPAVLPRQRSRRRDGDRNPLLSHQLKIRVDAEDRCRVRKGVGRDQEVHRLHRRASTGEEETEVTGVPPQLFWLLQELAAAEQRQHTLALGREQPAA